MAKKRVHEIAKERGLTSKEVLAKLHAAGVEVKAAASSIDEDLAAKALDGASVAATKEPEAKAAPKAKAEPAPSAEAKPATASPSDAAKPVRPVRPVGDGASSASSAAGGKRRRVVIDSQASRRDSMGPPPPQRAPRRRGGRRRRPLLEEPPPSTPAEEVEEPSIKIPSGASVKEVAETLGLSSAEVIKTLMT